LKLRLFCGLFAFSFLVLAACSDNTDVSTKIKANPESEYSTTFEKLKIGKIIDYDFQIATEDHPVWVTVWAEEYQNGKPLSEPVTLISYGLEPDETSQGPLGIGAFETEDGAYLFLYNESITMKPRKIGIPQTGYSVSGWQYALEEESLENNQSYLLAVYRATDGEMATYNFQDEKDVQQMIQDTNYALLIKMKLEERES